MIGGAAAGANVTHIRRYEAGTSQHTLDVLRNLNLQRRRRLPRHPNAPRRPLHAPENTLGDQLADFATLEPDDQAALLKILDALVTTTKLRALTAGAS